MNNYKYSVPTISSRIHKEFNRAARRIRGLFSKIETPNVWDNSIDHECPSGFKVYWGLLDEVRRHQQMLITGNPDLTITDYCLTTLQKQNRKQNKKALCIGCLEATRPEVDFLKSGLFQEVMVMDIAENLIHKQQQRADAEGLPVRYLVQDLNKVTLPPNEFDFIFATGTIHHISALEELFNEISRSLTDVGQFAMGEFVGPDRFQWTPDQMAIVNSILGAIPLRYRIKEDGRLKQRHIRPRIKDVTRVDPSEAIRSAEILPILSRTLKVVQSVELGGGMLHLLLDGIAGNFERDEEGRALLRALIEIDYNLTRAGLLPNNFLFAMAKA
jgi:SAM-dependent methyltransferase